MASGKRSGRGIRDRAIAESAGIKGHKLDLTAATSAAFLSAKSARGENSSSAQEGDVFYDTTLNGLRAYDGSEWQPNPGAIPKIVCIQETFSLSDFTDGGGAAGTVAMSHSIPAGAVFMYALVTDITGFAGDSSAVVTIGDGSDADRYNTGTPSVFTTAAKGVSMGAPSGTAWHTAAISPTITVTSAADFTSVSAGALTVTLVYVRAV